MTEGGYKHTARLAAELIMADLSDRRGFRQALDSVDDGVKEEILETWTKILEEAFPVPIESFADDI